MENNKHVIGIRCHSFAEPEQFLYNSLLAYFPEDALFFIVDELKGPKAFPENFNKIPLNTDFVEKHMLYNKGRVAWACGDYFYYAFRQQVNADYYWLIEPDVLLNLDSVADFFRSFEQNSADALVMNFSLAPEKWAWYDSAKSLFDPPYKCFFPLTRLSRKSVDIMYAKRRSVSAEFLAEGSKGRFPNDEALLANALMAAGVEPKNLSDFTQSQFNNFAVAPFKNKELSIQYCPNQILHPVKSIDFYKHAIKENIDDIFNNRMPNIVKNINLTEDDYQALQDYAAELFNENFFEAFYFKNRINYSLQKIVLSFKSYASVDFKRVGRAGNQLTFFMGQGLLIVLIIEAKKIVAYQRVYAAGVVDAYTETLLQTFPLTLLDSFEQFQATLNQLLEEHSVKNSAAKQTVLSAS